MTGFESSLKLIESAGMGSISTFIGLALSTVLDKKIGQDKSNLVGLVIESIIDFFGQKFVFMPNKKLTDSLAFRFVVAKILAIVVTQLLFMMVVWFVKVKIDEVTIQFVRLGTYAIAFFFVTYPLRKYWVFKDEKQDSKHKSKHN